MMPLSGESTEYGIGSAACASLVAPSAAGSQSYLTIRNAGSYAGSIAGAYAAVPTATFIGATESSRSIGSSTGSTRSIAT